jgi:hypothetical protein
MKAEHENLSKRFASRESREDSAAMWVKQCHFYPPIWEW